MKNSISRKICLGAVALASSCFLLSGVAFGYSGEAVRLYNQGTELVKEKKYTEAADNFEKAIFEDPALKDAYFNLGAVYKELGQNDKAKETLARLVRQDPFDDEALYLLGEMCFETGDFTQALIYLNTIPDYSVRYEKAQKISAAAEARFEEKNVEAKRISRSWDKKVITGFETPAGVTTDSQGNIYIANYKANLVEKITPNGMQNLKSEKLRGPVGLAVDSRNNVYVAGFNSNNIIKILPSGQAVTFVSGINQPYYLFVHDDILYITEQGKNNLILFNLLKD